MKRFEGERNVQVFEMFCLVHSFVCNNDNNKKKVDFFYIKRFTRRFFFSPAAPAAAASAGGRVHAPQRGHPADARAGAGASSSVSTAAAAAAEAEASSASSSAHSASLFLVVRRGVRVEDRVEKALEGADDGEDEGQDRGMPGPLLYNSACFFLLKKVEKENCSGSMASEQNENDSTLGRSVFCRSLYLALPSIAELGTYLP